jgi:hypothetical protein
MSSLAWIGLAIGIVIVALAVGIPYFHTHRRMRDHHDVTDSHSYLRERRVGLHRQRRAREAGAGTVTGPGPRTPGNQSGL